MQRASEIEKSTAIPAAALESFRVEDYCVAQKMSWASKRETERKEDHAYSLLGLFDINMPLIYGEGDKAFSRLQEEILRTSNDLSIFAWNGVAHHSFGLLAASPASFVHSSSVVRTETAVNATGRLTISNQGVSVEFRMEPCFINVYVAFLTGYRYYNNLKTVLDSSNLGKSQHVGIFLQRFGLDRYRRVSLNGKLWSLQPSFSQFSGPGKTLATDKTVLIERIKLEALETEILEYGFNIGNMFPPPIEIFSADLEKPVRQHHDIKMSVYSRYSAVAGRGYLQMHIGDSGVAGIIRLSVESLSTIFIHLGFDFDFNPIMLVSRSNNTQHKLKPLSQWIDLSLPNLPRHIKLGENLGVVRMIEELIKESNRLSAWKEKGFIAYRGSRSEYSQIATTGIVDFEFTKQPYGYFVEIKKSIERPRPLETIGSSQLSVLEIQEPVWQEARIDGNVTSMQSKPLPCWDVEVDLDSVWR